MGCQDVHPELLQKVFQMKVIDIHTHGIGGYDTRSKKVEDILRVAEILGSQGVSEIILTIYPSSIKVMRENMMVIKKAMERQGSEFRIQKSDLLPIMHNASRINGIHLEGPFLNPSKYGDLNARAFIEATEYNFIKLIEGFEDIVKVITIAPEIKGAIKLIKKISDRGIVVSMGHSDATFSEAEAGFNAGARGITHIFDTMRGFHHREPGIAGFGLINEDIYIEVIADPFHLHPKTLELIFKTKNPERIIMVSDSVKETKVKGRVKAVTDTHGKLLGGSMTIIESSRRLIQMGFDEDMIMRCITVNPERYVLIK
jgi:N-acetylglucosamine-6-phosphate deacetylase